MFKIDTGSAEAHISEAYDHVIDAMTSQNPTEDQINLAMAFAIIGEMRQPKTLKTVRKKMLYHWGRIGALAEAHPDVFDQIMQEYAEITTVLS